jgi:hypothetical protein
MSLTGSVMGLTSAMTGLWNTFSDENATPMERF